MWAKIKASPTFQKISSWCWHSLTVFWAYLQIVVASVAVGFDAFLNALNADPTVAEPLKTIAPPQWAGYLVGFIGVVTLLARLRGIMAAKKEQ